MADDDIDYLDELLDAPFQQKVSVFALLLAIKSHKLVYVA